MKYKRNCVISMFLIMSSFSASNCQIPVYNEKCITPLGQQGFCIPLDMCDPLYKMLLESPKIYGDQHRFIKSHHCGFIQFMPKVCCEMPSFKDTPSMVLKHRNIALLPNFEDCGRIGTYYTNGYDTVLGQFPWVALISYRKGTSKTFRCAGSIINSKYILTAAQCLTDIGNFTIDSVRVGEYNIANPTDCIGSTCAPKAQDILVEAVIPHSDYSKQTFFNDIGLIRLRSPIVFSDISVQKICLPITNELLTYDLDTSNDIVTVGWRTPMQTTVNTSMKFANVLHVDRDECQRKYSRKSVVEIGPKQICTHGSKEDFCTGDPGGPLFSASTVFYNQFYVQYGVVSFNQMYCDYAGPPSISTNVSQYMNWILDQLKP